MGLSEYKGKCGLRRSGGIDNFIAEALIGGLTYAIEPSRIEKERRCRQAVTLQYTTISWK